MGKRRMGKIKRIFTVCIVIGILGSILFHVVGITGNISADKIRKTLGNSALLNGRIVFQHNYFAAKNTKRGEIRVFDFTTLSAKTVGSYNTWCYAPRWSPDGKWILFRKGWYPAGEYWIISSDGKREKLVFRDEKILGWLYFWKNDEEINFVTNEGDYFRTAKINPRIEVTDVEEVRITYESMDSQEESEVIETVEKIVKEGGYPLVYNYHSRTFYTYGIHPSLLQGKIGNCVILPHKYSEVISDWHYIDSEKKLIKIKDISSDKILTGILISKIDYRIFYDFDNSYPKWSPIKPNILFDMNNPEVVRLVYLLTLDETEFTIRPLIEKYSRLRIFPSGGIAESYSSPCWSPDGKYFASTHHVPKGLNIKYAFNMKNYIYIHNIETGKGIDLIEGENPDWIE